jgi:hypothetical protein
MQIDYMICSECFLGIAANLYGFRISQDLQVYLCFDLNNGSISSGKFDNSHFKFVHACRKGLSAHVVLLGHPAFVNRADPINQSSQSAAVGQASGLRTNSRTCYTCYPCRLRQVRGRRSARSARGKRAGRFHSLAGPQSVVSEKVTDIAVECDNSLYQPILDR